jgi:hypothetical protein
MFGFGWLRQWREDRRMEKRFWKEIREKYAGWQCAVCDASYEESNSPWGPLYNVAKEDERLCRYCAGRAEAERKRRIELARQIVGQFMKPEGSPYRGQVLGTDSESAWKLAIRTANTDPFRVKRYDQFVRL